MQNSTIAKTLIASVASLALAATAAQAQGQGKGNGNGGGNGGGNAQAQGNPGGGNGGGNGNGNGNAANKGNSADKGNSSQNATRGNPGNGNGNAGGSANRNPGNGNGGNGGQANGNANRGDNGNGNDRFVTGQNGNRNGNGGKSTRVAIDPARTVERAGYIFRDNDRLIRSAGIIDGCPPGLAKKNNGCTPPGLDSRRSYRYDNADWWGLPGLASGDYRYYGGNLVRYGGGSILGYYPLLGGALSVGNVWPGWYDAQPIDPYYESYYGLGSDYRYADNVIYRTDPSSSAITSIAALLTGDSFSVGQPMPSGYDVYNVPYGYRDQYVDGPDAYYRYSDGYVYEVDPTTQLIQTAIQLLL